jgi:hypothetical protein
MISKMGRLLPESKLEENPGAVMKDLNRIQRGRVLEIRGCTVSGEATRRIPEEVSWTLDMLETFTDYSWRG